MGSEMVMVEGISFPDCCNTASAKTLDLLGHGITDIEIHFLQIKFTAIGVYFEKNIASLLTEWKGRTAGELAADDGFWQALISAPVEKAIRIVVIKEIKGSQYGVQLESAVRDRLVDIDKYEDEEEAALETIIEFLQSKYFKKDSILTFQFDAAESKTLEITFRTEDKEDAHLKINNSNVAEMLLKWYLGGGSAVSPSTIDSLAKKFADILSSPVQT